jgi:hypothetical protein
MPPSTADFERIDAVCAQPSPECNALRARLDGHVAATLLFLAAGKAPEVYPLARRAADAESVEIRIAAAEALGSVVANAADTPVLAELADDPVPAVRIAALGTLGRSGDGQGRRIARRAALFGSRQTLLNAQPTVHCRSIFTNPPAARAMQIARM